MMEKEFVVLEKDINKRLDQYISQKNNLFTRNYVQKKIDQKKVLVNDKNVKQNYKVKLNDNIKIDFDEPENFELKEKNIPLNIIFEDEDIIVVNKPRNMVVHPSNGHFEDTLVNALLFHCKKNLSYIDEDLIRPGIVHRIDKDTSGVIVVAKKNDAHDFLKNQFKKHSITRKYFAVCLGVIKQDEGIINKPIGRSIKDRKKRCIDLEKGKEAITFFKVIKRFNKYTFVELTLKTGRTHQIRVHMSSIGFPLMGDLIYGFKKQNLNLEGQILHAKVLGFIHPSTNQYIEFDTALPEYFINVLEKLEKSN